ncbi:HrpB1 family type III secretion system apparatus protein [Mitsuaria sp. GD03876]|uniref:HrpB1 family type III secretion system apparatus protein n=1 Tax=Mitsuaria sp. GD03876 TaxID=2975399 RepID=UPI002447D655|nr:HrpB1 family type III secretion system apparatus protein [Mitsuaria sp. GD03876]MDH0868426.1 HrpB1 family type III secretion system apparatus protein [Mitsuaria sp. GD03876]
MIDSSLQRKDFVSGLVGLVSLAVDRELLDDAEALLGAVRLLRPKVSQLDFFEAWIAMKRGHWTDAMRTLRNLDATAPEWATAKAFLAYCQFATGDMAWRATAEDVLHTATNPEALDMVRSLLNPEEEAKDGESEADEPGTGATPPLTIDLSQMSYLRA